MTRTKNFLLGQGEKLTRKAEIPSGGSPKAPPYPFRAARSFVVKRFEEISQLASRLPSSACPGDQAVAVITMHPRYLSKSDFPDGLLRRAGLTSLGSKPFSVTPRKWGTSRDEQSTRSKSDHATPTTALFVSGKRSGLKSLPREIALWKEDTIGQQLQTIEDISILAGNEKLRGIPESAENVHATGWFEVVIHNSGDPEYMSRQFVIYAKKFGVRVITEKRRDVGGLTFVPVNADPRVLSALSDFAFVRVARGMPGLRPFRPGVQRGAASFSVSLPDGSSLDLETTVAVFDGGIPDGVDLSSWVTSSDVFPIGKPVPAYQEHGLAVTSALLFGPLVDGESLPMPYSKIHHYRVLDSNSTGYDCYDVLTRITDTLDQNAGKYKFVNISLGPSLAIEDDEVTVWTAAIDEKLHEHGIVATVAAGNDGELDAIAGLNRIQPPADGVNVIAVGASGNTGDDWQRAGYSCVGPGRSPGIVKPDGVCFGGSVSEPFHVLLPSTKGLAGGTRGTSFASPLACRALVGLHAYYGDDLQPLATRAILLHRAQLDGRAVPEVGRGRFAVELDALATTDDCEAVILYQGELPVRTHLRADVPMPDSNDLVGMVNIEATLVFVPDVDPEHPYSYTRCGLEVTFRPHDGKFRKGATAVTPAQSKSFFSQKSMFSANEHALRADAHKWESCIRASRRFQNSSLSNPAFDIYYHRREGGTVPSDQSPIPYAMVITIRAEKTIDLYNKIVRKYAKILQPIRSRLQIPVSVSQ